ncbi:MAG TPA: GNAT family N-acetyltransferase [Pyrinomonadaceae bacterium]
MEQESAWPGGAWGQALHTEASPLGDEHETEVLAFLAKRPVHTVFLATLIRDNGLVSPLNRGTFYGCRDAAGRLTGVALIGHATLFESHDDAAIAAFAQLTQACPHAHLIRGEQALVERFRRAYERVGGRRPRRVAREVLLELRPPVVVHPPVAGLRLAASADLNELLPVNAGMIEDECGINPLTRDPVGFRVRLLRRIEQGRIWVWARAGRVVFKTDVLANTAAAAYLEGVWVHPAERGRGHGLRCLSQLSRLLLAQTEVISLVVNETAAGARTFYQKAGYRAVTRYDTIYL